MLAVIDYGIGNVRSICAALERLGVPHQLTAQKDELNAATGLILPGVGAFPDGMKHLRERSLVSVLNEQVLEKKKPILGICVGFQLMAKEGHEFGKTEGLGWIDASMIKLEPPTADFRVPHVGWNDCKLENPSPLFSDIPDNSLFYFTHSYHLRCENEKDVVGSTNHGLRFVSAVQKGNICGTQFHPEKSQQHGLKIFENFAQKVVGAC